MESGVPYVPCLVRGTTRMVAALLRQSPLELWLGPPVHLHALPVLRERLSEGQIQARIGGLFLQQVLALAERAALAEEGEGPLAGSGGSE
jgi:hypothetical protein